VHLDPHLPTARDNARRLRHASTASQDSEHRYDATPMGYANDQILGARPRIVLKGKEGATA
jgi:hypothetical protein